MTSRIRPVNPTTAEGPTKELFTAVKSKLGRIPNMLKSMGHSPAVLGGYLSLSETLGKGALPKRTQEQIALLVSQLNECEYCLAAHSLTGRLAGLTAEQIVAARRGEADDEQSQAALHLARHLVQRRGQGSDDDLNRAREAGLTEEEVAEVVGHVALNTFTNYFNVFNHTELDFPRVEVALPDVVSQSA